MALALVVTFLAVLGLLGLAAVRGSLLDRQRLVLRTRTVQAELLVESGREAGRLRLAADPGYEGETWDVADAGPAGPGRIVIRIEPSAAGAGGRVARITAEYPVGRSTTLVVRRSRAFEIQPSSSQSVTNPSTDIHRSGDES